MTSMADAMILLAALTAFGVLIIGWMMLPIQNGAEDAEAAGRPLGAMELLNASDAAAG